MARALTGVLAPGASVAVGVSGGMDSMVLLHVLARLAPHHGWRCSAIHVNHQLSKHADAWARFCRRECRARGVPLKVLKVTVSRGDSIEAAARDARYAAYQAACRAGGVTHIALAHHQDDQAETLLLRLLRGAGARGLAGMPAQRRQGDLTIIRPLLELPRSDIEAYAGAQQISWITDDSNADTYYLRNFLRAEILPRIEARVPAWRATLARAGMNLAEAALLQDELARIDGAGQVQEDSLAVSALAGIPPERQRNLLRYFLASHALSMPDRKLLDETLRQVLSAKADARLRATLDGHVLYRYRGQLHVAPVVDDASGLNLLWRGERVLKVPALCGTLTLRRSRGAGIDLDRLQGAAVTLRLRAGGEKLALDVKRPRRDVKALLREHDVAPWLRERVPFLWSGERLVWVAGLGIDRDFQAGPRVAGVTPVWRIDRVSG